jgi:MoxR-like ATPase
MKAHAYLSERDYVIPEDGINLVVPFLYHRISLKNQLGTPEMVRTLLLEKYSEFLG